VITSFQFMRVEACLNHTNVRRDNAKHCEK
jgi:hypothetical protein